MPLALEGMALGAFAVEHALQDRIGLMDVSDGLARDLPRLLNSRRSGLGAAIVLEGKMIHPEVARYCELRGVDAASFSFEGGEDYALLGSCPSAVWPILEALLTGFSVPSFRLGTVRRGSVTLNGTSPSSEGFDHFGA